MSTPTKPYIVWVDHGSEGWQPHDFDSLEGVRHFLLSGQSYGSMMVLTQLLNITLWVNE